MWKKTVKLCNHVPINDTMIENNKNIILLNEVDSTSKYLLKLINTNVDLKEGTIVIYESTVYPGATEETCIPILEKESNMRCGIDFKIGYSPDTNSAFFRRYS